MKIISEDYSGLILGFENVMETRYRPRKVPVQARSRVTVDAILDAAAQVLRKQGYAQTTTNAIAQRAGVSIGSLYEYFPNKEAVFAALKEKLLRAQFEKVVSKLKIDATASAKEIIERLLNARIKAAQDQPDVLAILKKEVPFQVLQAQRENDFSQFSDAIAAFAETHKKEIRVRDLATAIPLGIQMVDLYIDHLASQHPEMLHDTSVLKELTDMMCRYVLRST